jgi:hypothetical protein
LTRVLWALGSCIALVVRRRLGHPPG